MESELVVMLFVVSMVDSMMVLDRKELCHMLVHCWSCMLVPWRIHCLTVCLLAMKGFEMWLVTKLHSMHCRTLPIYKTLNSMHCHLSACHRRGSSLETSRCCWMPLCLCVVMKMGRRESWDWGSDLFVCNFCKLSNRKPSFFYRMCCTRFDVWICDGVTQ